MPQQRKCKANLKNIPLLIILVIDLFVHPKVTNKNKINKFILFWKD
jgi:hypothetical protein